MPWVLSLAFQIPCPVSPNPELPVSLRLIPQCAYNMSFLIVNSRQSSTLAWKTQLVFCGPSLCVAYTSHPYFLYKMVCNKFKKWFSDQCTGYWKGKTREETQTDFFQFGIRWWNILQLIEMGRRQNINFSCQSLYNTTSHALRLIYLHSHPNTFSQRLFTFA
jgi:hypothetical protein